MSDNKSYYEDFIDNFLGGYEEYLMDLSGEELYKLYGYVFPEKDMSGVLIEHSKMMADIVDEMYIRVGKGKVTHPCQMELSHFENKEV